MASHGIPRSQSAKARTDREREQELQAVRRYQEEVATFNSKVANGECSREILDLTTSLLKQNPEYYTIWNYRRIVLRNFLRGSQDSSRVEPPAAGSDELLGLVKSELEFLIPLLVKFPKCYWIWNHRIWVLQQSRLIFLNTTTLTLWQEELGLVSKMLNRDRRNFHGWAYRRVLVEQIKEQSSEIEESKTEKVAESTPLSITEQEFGYTTKMIQADLSNFSAWHNRSRLIPKLLDERHASDSMRRKALDDEFSLIKRALYTDPYDQSLWFYFHFLMSTLFPTNSSPSSFLSDRTDFDRLSYLKRELGDLREMLDGAEDCKWIYQTLLEISLQFLEKGGDKEFVSGTEMGQWLHELKKLDSIRIGRWNDFEESVSKHSVSLE